MKTKTTARIKSLPADLRAIADDMLAVKFPEPENEFQVDALEFGYAIRSGVTNAASDTLTEKNLQDAFDAMAWTQSDIQWPRAYGKSMIQHATTEYMLQSAQDKLDRKLSGLMEDAYKNMNSYVMPMYIPGKMWGIYE